MDSDIANRLLEALGYNTGSKSADERAKEQAREDDRRGLDYFVPPMSDNGVWMSQFPRHEEWIRILNMPLTTPEEIADFYYKLLAFYDQSYSSHAHRLMSIQLVQATVAKMYSLSDETRWMIDLLVSTSYDELDKKLEAKFEEGDEPSVGVSEADVSGETPAESHCANPQEPGSISDEADMTADGHLEDTESKE
jgi:hypothetical protein